MDKRQVRTKFKIIKFYERVNKALFIKLSSELVNNCEAEIVSTIINNSIKDERSWIKNVRAEIGLHGDDFIKNLVTCVIKYTYPKNV